MRVIGGGVVAVWMVVYGVWLVCGSRTGVPSVGTGLPRESDHLGHVLNALGARDLAAGSTRSKQRCKAAHHQYARI